MENITENNKLIAEFMGIEKDKIGRFIQRKANTENILYLQYHSSWDWLMPVVEKIEQMRGATVLLKPFFAEILWYGKSIVVTAEETKIEATYIMVVKFIKWHNQQKV